MSDKKTTQLKINDIINNIMNNEPQLAQKCPLCGKYLLATEVVKNIDMYYVHELCYQDLVIKVNIESH